MTDAVQAGRQNMDREPANELIRGQARDGLAITALDAESGWNARSASGVALSGACPGSRVNSRISRKSIVCVPDCRPLIRKA